MFKIRLLKPTLTNLLNVTNFTHSGFQERNLYQKCVDFAILEIMTNCRNFKVCTKIHNICTIHLKYIVNALIKMSNYICPSLKYFSMKIFWWKKNCNTKKLCDEKNLIKTFVLKNLKL